MKKDPRQYIKFPNIRQFRKTIQKVTNQNLKALPLKSSPSLSRITPQFCQQPSNGNGNISPLIHSYKINKYVLKGLPLTAQIETIQAAFVEKNIFTLYIRRMKTYTNDSDDHTHRLIPVYVLTLDNSEETRLKIQDLRGLLLFRITVEVLKNKETLVECLR